MDAKTSVTLNMYSLPEKLRKYPGEMGTSVIIENADVTAILETWRNM